MVDVVLTKRKIKPGKTRRLKEWMAEIRSREDEAVETYESEGMHSESAFIERTDEGDFLVYYMESEDARRAYEAFENSTHEIDREHKEVMEATLEDERSVGEYELLYHLAHPNRP
ncbi:DUF6176 family protein [Haladaptatus salinisoli]|uniref:DUF6176 family protein n=1 Tax=Haladaptatus salinisoli TaxID=2884876 RepID=UPI001D0B4E71|nr:DUF6176 family protein [Haladaptatus salinisoli]